MLRKEFDQIAEHFSRSLRSRVLLLTLGVFIAVSAPAVIAFNWIVDSTVLQLGTLFAEKQILYDRHRALAALNREVALAETLTRSPAILAWGAQENNPDKKARGLAELEHFRSTFSDRSYFFVIGDSRNYYFNDRAGQYLGKELRYTLDSANADDAWFFKTATMAPGCHLNVDHDRVLAVTKVWINCVVFDQGRFIGILGTGIDLSQFIKTVVNTDQSGIESMFIDASGAIQANRDQSAIEFRSFVKDGDDHTKTVQRLLGGDADIAKFDAMLETTSASATVTSGLLTVAGRPMLVGVGYLDKLGWFNVTLMDVDKIIDRRLFLPIAALLGLMMATAAILITWLFKRSVLDRLARAETAIAAVESGDFTRMVEDPGRDELSRFAGTLNRMALAVRDKHNMLETAVRERTAQLEGIAYLDVMTGILNRRGAVDAFAGGQHVGPRGFLLIDIDNFKEINDSFGHRAGDAIVVEVANRIVDATRGSDFCGRWGGDEFVIIAPDYDAKRLAELAMRIHAAIGGRPVNLPESMSVKVTPSIGAVLVGAGESIDKAAHKADLALYRAKRGGRNRWVIHDTSDERPATDTPQVA